MQRSCKAKVGSSNLFTGPKSYGNAEAVGWFARTNRNKKEFNMDFIVALVIGLVIGWHVPAPPWVKAASDWIKAKLQ